MSAVLIDAPVLVLNQNYQPLNVCNARRALVLLVMGKAELMQNGRGDIHSISQTFPVPSIIRLLRIVKRPLMRRRLSRLAVFHRDSFTCQYCGTRTKALTLDHIVPRSRGGAHAWENVVSACIPCNHRKAGATPAEANMRPLRLPKPPHPDPYALFRYRDIFEEWRQFIPW